MALVALVACGAPTDQERYRAVIRGEPAEAGAAFLACEQIDRLELRGDCQLAVVQRLQGQELSSWCPGFAPGRWQDECWFIEAERRGREGQVAPAARACERAGAFRSDCAQHLWQGSVHALIFGRGPGAFGEVLPRAEALHRRWSGPLAWDAGFDGRFWTRFYQNGFEGAGPRVMLTACDALPEPHPGRCLAAGVELFTRELGPGLARGGLDPCAATLDEVLRWVPADPDPRLEPALEGARGGCPQ